MEEHVYYGVIPSRIYLYRPYQTTHGSIDISRGWYLDERSVKTGGFIAIIGSGEETHVRVYVMPGGEMVSEASLGPMERHFVSLPNGTAFKVVSDKPVTVLVFSGEIPQPDAFEGLTPITFYPSVDGRYVGKEFVFMASQGLSGRPYHIFALEPSEITLVREDGEEQKFKLEANAHKALSLKTFKVYRVESTGNIMVQSGGVGGRIFFVPSATGGFLGRRFYTMSSIYWHPTVKYGFRISALQDTKVRIWDLQFRHLLLDFEVKAGETVSVKPRPSEEPGIAVESDEPITLAFVHDGNIEPLWSYGAGVSYLGIRSNEEVPLYLPTNSTVEVYIFAYDDSVVMIDDVTFRVKADTYLRVSLRGFHKIASDRDIIVQVIHWPLIPPTQGIHSFGVAVPSIRAVSASPDVKLTPIVEEQNLLLEILIWVGSAAALMVAAAGFFYMKRRSK
jgi:hypothetical protein